MKKIIAAIVSVLLICSVFCMTGCGEKTSITAETFKTTMDASGYTVQDATSQFADYPQITQVYIALGENGAYQIEFYEFDSVESARMMFNGNKSNFEATIIDNYSKSSSSLANYDRYVLTANEQFKVLSRIDNTLIYINVPVEYKDAVKTVLEQIGY